MYLTRALENQTELDSGGNLIANHCAPIFLVDGYNVVSIIDEVPTLREISLLENLNYLKLNLVANTASTAYLNINILGFGQCSRYIKKLEIIIYI